MVLATQDYVTDFAGELHGGEATIEMWGAGGSGARMCCCGGGIPQRGRLSQDVQLA